MKRLSNLFIASTLLCLACAAGIQFYGFKEPTSEDSMLVIGRMIIEDNQFTSKNDVIKGNIKVAIVGKTEQGKKIGLWAETDENGYFSLADVPKGEYAIKGFKVLLTNGELITVVNSLKHAGNRYQINLQEQIIIEGEYFPIEPVGRIVSLRHNLFILNKRGSGQLPIVFQNKQNFQGYKCVNGETLNDGPVEEYFIQKYPESDWREDLE